MADDGPNNLNFVRLVLAVGVIAWHSYPLTGRSIGNDALRQGMAEVWVDSFFTISGFLIAASWLRRPSVWRFLHARALRILPGFFVCLCVTAFVAAPLGVLLSGGNPGDLLRSGGPVDHVFANSFVRIVDYQVGGTPGSLGVPVPAWNGSLWTLWWECLCYFGVLVLGVTGLLRRGPAVAACLAGAWTAVALDAMGLVSSQLRQDAGRLGLMFLAGVALHHVAGRIGLGWRRIAVAAIVVAGTLWLPDYRLIAAPFLGYAVIGTGLLAKHPALVCRNDFSYGVYIYGFPVQQLLVIAGVGVLPIVAFTGLTLICTLPLAALSWFLIERPCQGFVRRPGVPSETRPGPFSSRPGGALEGV